MGYIRSWQKKPLKKFSNEMIVGDVNRGETLFNHLCVRCHGKYGEGGIGPAILNRDFLSSASDSYIQESIAHGRSGTAMFGWTKDLQDEGRLQKQGLDDIVVYMKSHVNKRLEVIHPGASLGRPDKGKDLFKQLCVECHGANGEGTKAPALNNDEFLNAATNGYLLATITLGRSGTSMPSWGKGSKEHRKLRGDERQDIVSYIRQWHKIVIRLP